MSIRRSLTIAAVAVLLAAPYAMGQTGRGGSSSGVPGGASRGGTASVTLKVKPVRVTILSQNAAGDVTDSSVAAMTDAKLTVFHPTAGTVYCSDAQITGTTGLITCGTAIPVGTSVNVKVVESAYGQTRTCTVTLVSASQTTYRVIERGRPPSNTAKHVGGAMSLGCPELTP